MTSSKYDFVKVRVWLSGATKHYYVLSCYLISRTLTVTKIPFVKAVNIALELKKRLVDMNLLDISQGDMENILFHIMEANGYGQPYIDCYRMVNHFFQQRRPLLFLICGAPFTGKSTLAQQLATRLNLPNVLQTDLIYQLLRSSSESPVDPVPVWFRPELSDSEVLTEFRRECWVVRKSVDGEIKKALKEGKSLIFEGMHLEPDLYIHEFLQQDLPSESHCLNACSEADNVVESTNPELSESCGGTGMTPMGFGPFVKSPRHLFSGSSNIKCNGNTNVHHKKTSSAVPIPSTPMKRVGVNSIGAVVAFSQNSFRRERSREEHEPKKICDHLKMCLTLAKGANAAEHARIGSGEAANQCHNRPPVFKNGCHGKTQMVDVSSEISYVPSPPWFASSLTSGSQTVLSMLQETVCDSPVFIPVIIHMDEEDHRILAMQSFSHNRSEVSVSSKIDFERHFARIRLLQEHLCNVHANGVAKVRVGITSIAEAINKLHDHFLLSIQASMIKI